MYTGACLGRESPEDFPQVLPAWDRIPDDFDSCTLRSILKDSAQCPGIPGFAEGVPLLGISRAPALQRGEHQAAESQGAQKLPVYSIFLQLPFYIYRILALSTLRGGGNWKII